jgi:hypothetical protein
MTESASDKSHHVEVAHDVPGRPIADAHVVGISYDLQFSKPPVEEMVERNQPTDDACDTVTLNDDTMLMRVTLYGWHPRERDQRICVVGVGDRHYRAMQAAERAWFDYHAMVLFAEMAGYDFLQPGRLAVGLWQ